MKALIVVDTLNDFLSPSGKLFCGEEARGIIPEIKSKIDRAHKEGDLVIYLCDNHSEDDKEFEKFPPHCIAGSTGAAIIDELAPAAPTDKQYVIKKTRYSGFFGTNLGSILSSNDVDEAEVVGVCTNICVMDTVGGLANRDIRVLVDAKAVADFDQKAAEAALQRMQSIYGAVVVP